MSQFTPTTNHFIASVNIEEFNDNLDFLGSLGTQLCDILNLKIVKETHFEYSPIGKTLVFIIATSHLSIHTWPENKYIHFDLLTCSDISETDFSVAINKIFENIKIFNLKYHKIAPLA